MIRYGQLPADAPESLLVATLLLGVVAVGLAIALVLLLI